MEQIHGVDFQPIEIDRHGTVKSGADELAAHAKSANVSDVVLMCHGFRNDANDARRLYTRFLETFADNRTHASLTAKLAGRTFAVGGVFWPSMVFPEPDDSAGAALPRADAPAADRQRLEAMKAVLDAPAAKKIDDLLARVGQAPTDPNARREMAGILLDLVRDLPADDANEVNSALAGVSPDALSRALTAGPVTVAAPESGLTGLSTPGGGVAAAGAGQARGPAEKVVGFVPTFLNLTTFLLMFHRCGIVGEKGMSDLVRKVKAAANAKIHLVGHSLGGRAVTACAKALLDAPPVQADSMMLLEAAYSHFGLSAAATAASSIAHPRGFFRDVIEKQAVKGPILATHSERDLVVALAYTPMAAISLNNSRGVGLNDESSPFGGPFGGIGRNGVIDAPEAERLDLNDAGVAYTFAADKKIHNLNGSRKVNGVSIIDSHGDVTSPAITWAFASLVAGV
jgi:hypothetical protein